MKGIAEWLKQDAVLIDKFILSSVLFLSIWGIMCVYSAGAGNLGRGFELALKQTVWVMISFSIMSVIIFTGYEKILEGGYAFFALSMIFLILTDIFARRVNGAQSWLGIGGMRFQPSEFAKIALILAMSKFLTRNPPIDLSRFFVALGIAFIPVILVLLQPDLGSALVYIVITFGMLIVAGAPWKYLISIALSGLSMLPFMIIFMLKEYQVNRIMVFIDPMRDPLGAGYNVIQSRIAVGSGGFFGKGYMLGTQSKLRFLPEPHTDFIFSVLSEEFGFLGNMILIILFAFILLRVINTGVRSRDSRCKILVSGVASWLWFQFFESLGMSIGIMPVTGLPLPFLSYGGSSLLSNFAALGIVLSIYIEGAKDKRVLQRI